MGGSRLHRLLDRSLARTRRMRLLQLHWVGGGREREDDRPQPVYIYIYILQHAGASDRPRVRNEDTGEEVQQRARTWRQSAKQEDVRELRLLLHGDVDDERHEAVVHHRLDGLEHLRRAGLPDLAHSCCLACLDLLPLAFCFSGECRKSSGA